MASRCPVMLVVGDNAPAEEGVVSHCSFSFCLSKASYDKQKIFQLDSYFIFITWIATLIKIFSFLLAKHQNFTFIPTNVSGNVTNISLVYTLLALLLVSTSSLEKDLVL